MTPETMEAEQWQEKTPPWEETLIRAWITGGDMSWLEGWAAGQP